MFNDCENNYRYRQSTDIVARIVRQLVQANENMSGNVLKTIFTIPKVKEQICMHKVKSLLKTLKIIYTDVIKYKFGNIDLIFVPTNLRRELTRDQLPVFVISYIGLEHVYPMPGEKYLSISANSCLDHCVGTL